MHTFIDLFAGIGGFRIALENQGLKCVFSSEIDRKTRKVYRANFKDEILGDITRIESDKIPSHDIICAGFPCQSFSVAGKHGGFNDVRGLLFYEIIRIAEYHKPKVLLLENVTNILAIDNGKVFDAISNSIKETGYTINTCILNSSHFGIPQSRKRAYFICIRHDLNFKFIHPVPTYEQVFLTDILDKELNMELVIQSNDIQIDSDIVPLNRLMPIKIGEVGKGHQGNKVYHVNGHAITQLADGGGLGSNTGLYLIDGHVRKLSINECKKVMGFPESFYVSESSYGKKQLGNAVIPKIIEVVYNSISQLN